MTGDRGRLTKDGRKKKVKLRSGYSIGSPILLVQSVTRNDNIGTTQRTQRGKNHQSSYFQVKD